MLNVTTANKLQFVISYTWTQWHERPSKHNPL